MGYVSYQSGQTIKDQYVVTLNSFEVIRNVNDLLLSDKDVSSKVESINSNVNKSLMIGSNMNLSMTIVVSDVNAYSKIMACILDA